MAQTMELSADGEVRGPPPDPMLGRRLLHYRVEEVIGQGGMSVVYRGRDERLGRDVAIKVLHPFLAEKEECRVRLAREARAVARLEHDNIVKVFDFSGDGPTLDEKPGADNEPAWSHPKEGFIVAELVRGPTLKRFGERHALWRCPEVGAMVVWQLARALQHAHDAGVVHRDIKPENVMVRDDGVLKLMDFGIAQIADQGGLTVTGTLLGSPAHMAPECIDGHQADVRSDVFSMGTVLYWATTGSLPFEALTPHALLKLIVDGKAAPAQQKSPRVSDELQKVITRAMMTRPDERYQTAGELADALGEVLGRAGLPASSGRLREILAAPEKELAAATASVRATCLERAEHQLGEGQTARALATLNRVLADNPADADARALLDRLHADDDVEEAPASPAIISHSPQQAAINDAAGVYTPAPGALTRSSSPSSSSSSSSSSPEAAAGAISTASTAAAASPTSPSTALRWQSWLVGVAAVGTIALAVLVARAVDDAEQPVSPPPPAAGLSAREGPVGLGEEEPPSAVDPEGEGPDRETPTRAHASPKTLKKKQKLEDVETLRRALPVVKVVRPGGTPAGEGATTTPAEGAGPAVAPRNVTFRVKPWADIVVDGAVVARGTLSHTAPLPPGPHTVVFQNPSAKEHEVRFTVVADGPDPMITARLEPRPALLVVHCNVPDAFVDVAGGGGAKPAGDTAGRPLVVPLEDASKLEREVFVYKKGFEPYRRRHLFLAGKTLELDVVLEPEPVEPVAP